MKGIIKARYVGKANSQDYIQDLVRVPIHMEMNDEKFNLKNVLFRWTIKGYNKLLSASSPFTNLVIVIIHFLTILLLAFPLCIVITLTLTNILAIRSSPDDEIIELETLLFPSSQVFWINEIFSPWIVYISLGWGFFILIVGVLELVSYYCTYAKDTGKYERSFTKGKRLLSSFFFALTVLMIWIYLAYFFIVLVWCVFGAVLNPSTFLPIAVGAVTFIVFVIIQYKRMLDLKKNLKQLVAEVVEN